MTNDFNKWWDSNAVTQDASCGRWDADNIPKNNPYTVDTPAFWAWEGWQAGVIAEREACAQICEDQMEWGEINRTIAIAAGNCADLIRERGES